MHYLLTPLLALTVILLGANDARAASNTAQAAPVLTIPDARMSPSGPTLNIATLNTAHGRGSSLNQILVSGSKARQNLEAVGHFLRDHNIHIAALQEVDAPSWWSGDFDHTELVAQAGEFGWYSSSPHANLKIGTYGTAIVSALPIRSAYSHDFPPTPPTARKGFTTAEIEWTTENGNLILDIVSIHMDFSRESVRQGQLQALRLALADRTNPLIIMGDFNSEEIAHQLISEESSSGRFLHTPQDIGENWQTYKDKRLDWILISNELEFIDYRTLPEVLSDHRLVAAQVRLRSQLTENE